MIFDKQYNVWMALYHGLAKWDIQKDEFSWYPDFIPYRGDTLTISIDLTADNQNNIWVATIDHGLQKFDPAIGKFLEADTPENNQTHSISSVALQSIITMDDTLMAMGTSDAGIDIFNRRARQSAYFTAADGLPGNNVGAVYYYPPHSLWAATEQGLCRIDLATRHITTYGAEDGIAGNDFADALRFYRLKNGDILAGYKGGFVCVTPDSLSSREPPRDVTINRDRVFEQPLSVDSILHGSDTAVFSHGQNFISIHYTSLGYTEPDRIRYYYQMEGVDPDWVGVVTTGILRAIPICPAATICLR